MIAKTILNQIKAGTDTRGFNGGTKLMMCWGANRLQATEKGLRFKVNGALFKGFVEVTLDEGRDLYNVVMFTMRRPRKAKDEVFNMNAPVKKVAFEFDGVYCDQLTSLIDSTVERAA